MNGWHVRCYYGLREIENAGEASQYLDIRSFCILLNCMNLPFMFPIKMIVDNFAACGCFHSIVASFVM